MIHLLDPNPRKCEGCAAIMMHGECECGARNRMLILSQITQRLIDATQGFPSVESGDEASSIGSRCQIMEQDLLQHPYHPAFLSSSDIDVMTQTPNTTFLHLLSPEPAMAAQFPEQQTLPRRRITTNLKIDGLWEYSKDATHKGMETLNSFHKERQAIIARQSKVISLFEPALPGIFQQLNENSELLKMRFRSTIERLTRQGIDQLLYNESFTDFNKTPARFSKEIKQILNESFVNRSPYPTEDEKERLTRLCKLDYKQVSVWFANKRMRTKIHSNHYDAYPTRKPLSSKTVPNIKFQSAKYSDPEVHTSSDSSVSGSPFTISSMESIRGDSFSPIATPSLCFLYDSDVDTPPLRKDIYESGSVSDSASSATYEPVSKAYSSPKSQDFEVASIDVTFSNVRVSPGLSSDMDTQITNKYSKKDYISDLASSINLCLTSSTGDIHPSQGEVDDSRSLLNHQPSNSKSHKLSIDRSFHF
ncbi:Pre-B-cell leukemia transcription factor 1 [Basidiobolus ranarum]|uniref:Pre-B-cell leukemia transcription factor 1 n=1 Tax=Basidiobolus ranarum TaxID=34480 RepID=A0ABR2WB84_9FUNG